MTIRDRIRPSPKKTLWKVSEIGGTDKIGIDVLKIDQPAIRKRKAGCIMKGSNSTKESCAIRKCNMVYEMRP